MELEEARKQISTLTENLKEKDEKLAALTSYTQKSDELIHTVSSTFRFNFNLSLITFIEL